MRDPSCIFSVARKTKYAQCTSLVKEKTKCIPSRRRWKLRFYQHFEMKLPPSSYRALHMPSCQDERYILWVFFYNRFIHQREKTCKYVFMNKYLRWQNVYTNLYRLLHLYHSNNVKFIFFRTFRAMNLTPFCECP